MSRRTDIARVSNESFDCKLKSHQRKPISCFLIIWHNLQLEIGGEKGVRGVVGRHFLDGIHVVQVVLHMVRRHDSYLPLQKGILRKSSQTKKV